eukprot:gene2081-2271_t
MTRDEKLLLSKCCEENYIQLVDKTLLELYGTKEKPRALFKPLKYLQWNSCDDRSQYQELLLEIFQDLPNYFADEVYDLAEHANNFELDLSDKKVEKCRQKKGFLLSVVNLAFRAVGSERLPQDITIELMKVKYEDLDYEGKYYFKDLLEEEWKVLLDYHNYLQTSLHYVKADTNDLPLMESSEFLAGIYKCLQGSFKSLGKEAKRLHIIYKEFKKFAHHDSDKELVHENNEDMEYTAVLDDDDNDYESVFSGPIGGFTEAIKPYVKKDSSTTALPPGNKVMEMLHTFNGTSGASNAKRRSAEQKNHQEKPSRIVDQSSSNDDNDAEEPYRDNNTGNDATDHEGSDSDGELLFDFFDFPYVDAIDHKRATSDRGINADEERDKKRQRKEDNRVMVFFPLNAADNLADHEIDRNFPITGITESILSEVEKKPDVLKCNFSAVYESCRASCLIARS